jgi:hypothetical protein
MFQEKTRQQADRSPPESKRAQDELLYYPVVPKVSLPHDER